MIPEQIPLAPDELWGLCENERRRLALLVLDDEGGRHEVRPLARRVAAREQSKPVADVTPAEHNAAYTSLRTHLLRLSHGDLVDYDVDTGAVRPAGATAPVAAWIRALEKACPEERASTSVAEERAAGDDD